MEKIYDIAIIGTGPAGLSAAINGVIRNKNIILFGNGDLTTKLQKAPEINNYLGFYSISGVELGEKFKKHIANMDIKITEEKVNAIYAMGESFSIMVNEKEYAASAVILATGMEFTKPIKGETEFLGLGVGYCATCDAPLYRDKTVVIIGYNEEAEEEANYLSELVKELYYVPMKNISGKLRSDIEIVNDMPVEIKGCDIVESIQLKNREILTDGVFILKDSLPPAQLVPGLEIIDGHIATDRSMKTNIKGCYAAGDCTGKPYQYIKAAGEGQVAVLNAVAYLNSIKYR
ncbi:NAD(P)/FAD-dependent oxidoreductase [Clostridium sp. BJN0001]|uniref:NAD(P)/FAD-dependent oxidoreductase n=1 Tax=Clostridium sp. BJN0001 TaxID=2930219 RepID=UPI001FCFF3C5|nr:NAD(P)/FAD-dependent oxidoreductase [Clostridium sp. BJN0001]